MTDANLRPPPAHLVLPPIYDYVRPPNTVLPRLHDLLPDLKLTDGPQSVPSNPDAEHSDTLNHTHLPNHSAKTHFRCSSIPRSPPSDLSQSDVLESTQIASPATPGPVSSPQPDTGSSCLYAIEGSRLDDPHQRETFLVSKVITAPPAYRAGSTMPRVRSSPGKKRSRAKVDFEKAMSRKTTLEADPWIQNVNPEDVTCVGCRKVVQLQPGRKYYPRRWKLHKERCRVILEESQELKKFAFLDGGISAGQKPEARNLGVS